MTRDDGHPPPYVPDRRCAGGTALVLGCGPSLTAADVAFAAARADLVIAVNDSFRLCPSADVLYACDMRWWEWHPEALAFAGLKICLDARAAARWPGLHWLRRGREEGIEVEDRSALALGRNGGHQAINLAVHFGARRVVLLGFDGGPAPDGRLYFHAGHPKPTGPDIFAVFAKRFRVLRPALDALGVEVRNATPASRLDAFDRCPLLSAFPIREDACAPTA